MRERDDEQFLRTIVATARKVPPVSPDLDDRIMAAVRATRAPRWRIVVGWLMAPRTVRISPVGALAYAAGFAVVLLGGARVLGGPPSPAVDRERSTSAVRLAAASDREAVRTVRFVLLAPEAAQVAVVGDFNRWSPAATPLRPSGVSGVWTVDVPLPAGRHEYAFIVDGTQWMPDPAAPRAPVAEFGTPNSVITVTPEVS